jgi:hypothetical protein
MLQNEYHGGNSQSHIASQKVHFSSIQATIQLVHLYVYACNMKGHLARNCPNVYQLISVHHYPQETRVPANLGKVGQIKFT